MASCATRGNNYDTAFRVVIASARRGAHHAMSTRPDVPSLQTDGPLVIWLRSYALATDGWGLKTGAVFPRAGGRKRAW
jgi:hypothetical protein